MKAMAAMKAMQLMKAMNATKSMPAMKPMKAMTAMRQYKKKKSPRIQYQCISLFLCLRTYGEHSGKLRPYIYPKVALLFLQKRYLATIGPR